MSATFESNKNQESRHRRTHARRLQWSIFALLISGMIGCIQGTECRTDPDCRGGLRCAAGFCVMQTGRIWVAVPASPTQHRITATLRGPFLPAPITQELRKQDGRWTTFMEDVPRGDQRTLTVQSYNAAGTLLSAPSFRELRVEEDMTTVTLFLLPSDDNTKELPFVRGLIATFQGQKAGQNIPIRLVLSSPKSPPSYNWTTTAGTCFPENTLATTWRSPTTPGQFEVRVELQEGQRQHQISFRVDLFPRATPFSTLTFKAEL